MIATIIVMISGIAASRVSRPTMMSAPHTISTTPTNGPITSGNGIPMRVNRPTPRISGKISFWMPSGKNTAKPTIRRIKITHPDARVRSKSYQLISGCSS
jgi:hypothetical protein